MDATGAIRRRDKKIPGVGPASGPRSHRFDSGVVQWTVSPTRKDWSAQLIPTNRILSQHARDVVFMLYTLLINNVCRKITKMDVPVERFNGRNV